MCYHRIMRQHLLQELFVWPSVIFTSQREGRHPAILGRPRAHRVFGNLISLATTSALLKKGERKEVGQVFHHERARHLNAIKRRSVLFVGRIEETALALGNQQTVECFCVCVTKREKKKADGKESTIFLFTFFKANARQFEISHRVQIRACTLFCVYYSFPD